MARGSHRILSPLKRVRRSVDLCQTRVIRASEDRILLLRRANKTNVARGSHRFLVINWYSESLDRRGSLSQLRLLEIAYNSVSFACGCNFIMQGFYTLLIIIMYIFSGIWVWKELDSIADLELIELANISCSQMWL